jgi:hypothetical protein
MDPLTIGLIGGGLSVLGNLFGDDDPTDAPTESQTRFNYLDPAIKAQRDLLLQGFSGLPNWQNFTGQLPGLSALQSQAIGAAGSTPGAYQHYFGLAGKPLEQRTQELMNPYIGNVVDRIAQLGQRNLTENLLPQVNATFTGSNTFGGSRNADFTARALRDVNESILGAQSQALQGGFSGAQNAAAGDLARQQTMASQAQAMPWQDIRNLWALGAGERGVGTEQAQWDLNKWNMNQQGPLAYLTAQANALKAMPQETSTEQFGNQAPPTTQTMNPISAAGQGILGGLSLFKAFS